MWIIRNQSGSICGLTTNKPAAGNLLPDNTPEVLQFFDDTPLDRLDEPLTQEQLATRQALEAEIAAYRFARDKADVLTEARQLRTQLFARLDGMQASANATGDTTLAGEIEGVKVALRDLPGTVDLSQCTTLEQMRAAVVGAWKAIAAPCSAQLKTAFAGFDQ